MIAALHLLCDPLAMDVLKALKCSAFLTNRQRQSVNTG